MTVDLTPYSTARPFIGALATWLPERDAERMAAYMLYEQMYDNVPTAYKLIQRGTESNPIYVPSAKILIEATNRFLAKKWTYSTVPNLGTPEEQATLEIMLANLFRREQMWTKFATQKRYGLIRGDAVLHLVGNERKAPGTRVSVYELDPASYFPIEDPNSPGKIIGCHLVDPMKTADGAEVIRRQTYRKITDDAGIPLGVSYEQSWWETGGWDDRDGSGQVLRPAKKLPDGATTTPPTALPELITSIPVYHWKNSRIPSNPFGKSELAGLERIAAAVSQAISDEELELALSGLGVYATTSGPPTDDDGNEINWRIGPGWVVEIDDESTWQRVNGVMTVAPVLDHVGYLDRSMAESLGVSSAAIGRVDVATAESGIAIALHMAPLLAKNEEKEGEILSVTDHMLYDLTRMWLPTYEPETISADSLAQAVSIVDDPMPINRQAVLDEIVLLVTTKLISAAYAQQLLSERLGYEFPKEMLADIVAEEEALAKARNADPFVSRVAQELEEAVGG